MGHALFYYSLFIVALLSAGAYWQGVWVVVACWLVCCCLCAIGSVWLWWQEEHGKSG